MQFNRNHIFTKMLAMAILAIFSLAIIPWASLHSHEEVTHIAEENCTHKVHVKKADEHCLICKAHFEKNYTKTSVSFVVFFKEYVLDKVVIILGQTFTQLISTSLRGPPSFS